MCLSYFNPVVLSFIFVPFRSFPSSTVMVAASVHFQLEVQRNDRTFGPRPCSSEQHAWGPGLILPPPASAAAAAQSAPQNPNTKQRSSPRGNMKAAPPSPPAPIYQPGPTGIHDLHLWSAAFRFRRLQPLFKSKIRPK